VQSSARLVDPLPWRRGILETSARFRGCVRLAHSFTSILPIQRDKTSAALTMAAGTSVRTLHDPSWTRCTRPLVVDSNHAQGTMDDYESGRAIRPS
jgi:hypothetical protein